MFRNTLLSSPISLFSSTSSNPFSLFSVHVDPSLQEDSACILVQDDTDRRIEIDSNDATLLYRDPKQFKLRTINQSKENSNEATEDLEGHSESDARKPLLLTQAVLHLQSPTLSTTFIRSPPLVAPDNIESNHFKELGLKNPCIHFQLRPLGSRPLVIEIGIKDVKGQLGRIRLSNFQARPTLYLFSKTSQEMEEEEEGKLESKSPLLHLPISLPSSSTTSKDNSVLTEWCSFSLNLPYLIPHLHNPSLLSFETAKAMSGKTQQDEEEENEEEEESTSPPPILVPFDRFESVAFVKVHANCRLRRIYLTESSPESQNLTLDEFELYGS